MSRSATRAILEFADRPPLRGTLANLFNLSARLLGEKDLAIFHDGRFWMCVSAGAALPRSERFDLYRYDIEHLPCAIRRDLGNAQDFWSYLYTLQEGDVVIDVGAEIGTDTLYFSRQVGERGRVVAIEASPRTFAKLQSTIAANGVTNATALNVAAWDCATTIRITNSEPDEANFVAAEGDAVPAERLDDILRPLGLEKISFVKMNIEGAERPALAGMTETLARTRHVAVACHDFEAERTGNDWFRTKAFVREYLRDSGFEVVERDDPRPYVRDHLHGIRRE